MSKTALILFGGDFALALLAQACCLLARSAATPVGALGQELGRVAVFVAAVMASSYLAELFAPETNRRKRVILVRIVISLAIAYAALWLLRVFLPGAGQPVLFTMSALCIFGLLQFMFHCGFHLVFRIPGMAEKILIFGGGPMSDQLASLLAIGPHGYIVAGTVRAGNESVGEAAVPGGIPESLTGLALRKKIDKIVISLTERRGILPVGEILSCKLSGIEVVDAMSFYEEMTGKVLVEKINPSWFIFSGSSRMTYFRRFIKRIFDLVFAGFGVLLCLPIFPVIALLIKCDSPGPVFFRQVRVGKGEKNFTLFKFRTMHEDAEKATGPVWAAENDPRITRVGRWLRKSRLDEAPQLFNVLRGDMSIVGPRPERPEFMAQLGKAIPYYAHRHHVKPGATGWAQVKYAYGASIEDTVEKLRYDLYYIKNYSLWLDLVIIVETVKVVLFGRGAR